VRRGAGLLLALAITAGACVPGGDEDAAAGEPGGALIIEQRTRATAPPTLFVLELGSLDLRPTTPDAVGAAAGRWSPDGSHVMWTEEFDDGERDILIQGERDAEPTRVVGPGAETVAVWSPDCVRIAFARSDPDGDRGGLWVMDLDGSGVEQVTDGSRSDTAVDWSPMAERLVFMSDRGGDAEIVVIDVNGGNETVLTDNTVGDTWPRWSPDGGRIAWASRVNERKHVFVMDSDGGDVVQVTTGSQGGEFPVWSPDGEWIAYAQANSTIAIMRSDGSDRRVLDVTGTPTDWGPKTGEC